MRRSSDLRFMSHVHRRFGFSKSAFRRHIWTSLALAAATLIWLGHFVAYLKDARMRRSALEKRSVVAIRRERRRAREPILRAASDCSSTGLFALTERLHQSRRVFDHRLSSGDATAVTEEAR